MVLHRTYRKLNGKDAEGRSFTRRIYCDDERNEYVSLGRYAFDDPRTLVPIDYFIGHIASTCSVRDEWHYMPGTWEPAY